jgi:LysM repeat protein
MTDHRDDYGFWGDEPSRPTRRHGVVEEMPEPTIPVDLYDTELVDEVERTGWFADVDPMLKRVGLMVLVAALLVPIALAFRDGDEPKQQLRSVPPVTEVAAVPVSSAPVVGEGVGGAAAAPAAVAVVSKVRVCTSGYQVVAGDFWIRIAKLHGITLKQLLAANNARSTTPIYPGRTVCLPAGVQARTRINPVTTPTTVAATPTTKAPAKAAPSQVAAAPTAPATTVAPTRTYTRDEVMQIIRAVWPDELEERAIEIATRESNLIPTARNSCCFGLFQMYFNVHKSWLGSLGVTSSSQLFDPTVNANAALALYNRAGGWGPWQ